MKSTINSHLVSQVLLRRFAVKNDEDKWVTIQHDKDQGSESIKEVEHVACKEVPRKLIQLLEAEWSDEIEKHANKAINSLAHHNWTEAHFATIKDLIALHLIRSQAFQMVEDNKDDLMNRIKVIRDEAMEENPELSDVFNYLYEKEARDATLDVSIGVLVEYIRKTRDFLTKPEIGLDIGFAPEGKEFIIGEVPVISIFKDGKIAPITDAKYVGMPITPKIIVTLKTKPTRDKPVTLTPTEVDRVNQLQMKHTYKVFFSKPSK
ncbi:MAG: hypothetical protein JWM00_715 [Candidatus Saccharibacteria bacterium]|nr:hypothetical protein [Candidatus Saccharibacteria bacterium]